MMSPSFPDLDVVGIKVEPEKAENLRRKVASLLGQTKVGYPGAAPVSFSSQHLAELQQKDYYVCEKTDGIRCLMYMERGSADSEISEMHYLIDRKNHYRHVPGLHFPKPDDETFLSIHHNTIIDGELVLDTYEDGSQQLKYLVFDILTLGGHRVMHDPFDKRLVYLNEEEGRPFIVEDKSMHFSYNIEMMFRDIIPKVKRIRGNGGLIFVCCSTSYYIGLDEHILKWKPASDNTVDFRLHLQFPVPEPDPEDKINGVTDSDYDSIPIRHLSVMLSPQENLPFGEMYLTWEEWDDLRVMRTPLEGTIIECYKDDQSHWRFYRLRNDKRDANPISVVEKALDSIADCVTEEGLIRAAPAIKAAWEARQGYHGL
ncbi:mRNA capping enzyme, catalytic domain-containing protein [Aspergillus pseudotamarii]|uniref:mRNA guanylyltransferase n=1 Tax=Aspergillus pseudotamarii TaxID=132259 RepID=A0A5N6T3F9_ASPPS|nr:mRNA capping enzyme, catalytic domain-containing protein [Aspergillus pseudotamarii]KAE8140809.1 mRNA capping enzyme, catalytic domain-containing protein [Aspergillus pseudotamarii]